MPPSPSDVASPARMPAEWEPHEATWIAWPHHEPDWPGKIGPIPWVYAEIVRALAPFERVEILCDNQAVRESARHALTMHDVDDATYRLHLQPTDRVWLRDSGPITLRLGELRRDAPDMAALQHQQRRAGRLEHPGVHVDEGHQPRPVRSDPLENAGRPHAGAHAHRHHAVLQLPAAQLSLIHISEPTRPY